MVYVRKGVVSAAVLMGALLSGPAARADADSLSDSIGPRGLGLGEALRAAAAGSSSITMNPAGLSLGRSYSIEGSYGFRPEDDATSAQLSVCDSNTPRVAGCLYYNYFDASPTGGERALHETGMTLSMALAEKFLIGVSGKYVDYTETGTEAQPMDNSRDGSFVMDAGLIIKATDIVNLALVGYNVVGHDQDNFPRAVGSGVAVYASPALMLAGDARWNLDAPEAQGTPGRYSAGAEYFFSQPGAQQGFPVRAGFVFDEATDASFVAAGFGYVTTKVALDFGLRKQVAEGDEMMVQFGLRLFMPSTN